MAQSTGSGSKSGSFRESRTSPHPSVRRPWYRKKRFILPLILIALLVIGSLVHGGGNVSFSWGSWRSSPRPSPLALQPTAPPAAGTLTFPGATPLDVVAAPDQTVDIDGMAVMAGTLTASDSPQGRALCTDVSYTNNTAQPAPVNSISDWKLQNPAGTVVDSGFFGFSPLVASGQLQPGGQTAARVCFAVLATGELPGDYIVRYEPFVRADSHRGAWVNQR